MQKRDFPDWPSESSQWPSFPNFFPDNEVLWKQNAGSYHEINKPNWNDKPFAYPSDNRQPGFKPIIMFFMPLIIFLIVALIVLHLLHKKCRHCKKNRRDPEARVSRPNQATRSREQPRLTQMNERRNETQNSRVHRPITPSAPSFHSEDGGYIISATPHQQVASSTHPTAPDRPASAEDLPPSYNEVIQQLNR